jgi:hypothetical protein
MMIFDGPLINFPFSPILQMPKELLIPTFNACPVALAGMPTGPMVGMCSFLDFQDYQYSLAVAGQIHHQTGRCPDGTFNIYE